MKIATALLIVTLFMCHVSNAQDVKHTFKGTVTDSVTTKPLKDVTVSFYKAKDTTLANFCFTTPNGNYNIELHLKDSLLMIVSCIGYKEQIIHFPEMAWDWAFDSKNIKMAHSSHELKGITITAGLISIKGDTIEINASRIKILPNSDVSQLLKKIPGFEIKKDGSIKVNGNGVSRILVDGSDFFGSNPALVAKNLNADMVDKVQVFDDKDDNGVVSSDNTKTINLKLKKGKRLGFFGDAMAGYGTDGHYEGGLRINSFKDDRKISFISNSNNINDQGFDFGFDNWHRANSILRTGGLSRYIYYSNPNDGLEGKGNLNTRSDAAFSYFNEFSKKRKLSFTAGYTNNNYITDRSSVSITPLSDSLKQVSNNTQTTNGTANYYYADLNYTREMDSTGRFGIGAEGEYSRFYQNYESVSSIFNNSTLVNSGINDIQKNTTKQSAGLSISYYKRSHKSKYKYISMGAKSTLNNSSTTAYQFSQGVGSNYNYKNVNSVIGNEYLVQATGVLPLVKSLRAGITADGYLTNNINHANAYSAIDFSQHNYNQDYNTKIDSLSINFFNSAKQYSAKGFLTTGTTDYNLSAGVTYLDLTLYNQDKTTYAVVNKNYNLFLPFVSFSDWKKTVGYASVNFEKVVDFPTNTQLLPINNVSNPWIRLMGNPNLLPFEQWNLQAHYSKNNYKFLKNIWTAISISQSDQYIAYTNTINDQGITYRTPLNLKGYLDERYTLGPTIKCTKIINFNLWFTQHYSRVPELLNGVNNMGVNSQFSATPGIEIQASDATEFNFSVEANYTNYKNQLNPSLNFNQVIPGVQSDLRTDLWRGSELRLNIEVTDDRAIPGIGKVVTIANVYLQQAIDKGGKYNLKLTCYDLLNQNISLSRTAMGSYITIQQSNILRRFFMLTVVYKMKGKKTEGGGAVY